MMQQNYQSAMKSSVKTPFIISWILPPDFNRTRSYCLFNTRYAATLREISKSLMVILEIENLFNFGRCYVPGYRPHSGLANVACPGPRAHSGPVNVACPGRPATQWPVERCVPGCPGARPRSGQCVPGPSATFVISLTQRQGNLALVSCNTFGWWNVPSVPRIPLNYVIVNGAFLSNGTTTALILRFLRTYWYQMQCTLIDVQAWR